MPRVRLDHLVTEKGLAESREKAQRLIRSGAVRVDGHPQTKPGHLFPDDARVEATEKDKYVSRGGIKLETVAGYANAGIDLMSSGALTNSAPVLDIGLDIGPVVTADH